MKFAFSIALIAALAGTGGTAFLCSQSDEPFEPLQSPQAQPAFRDPQDSEVNLQDGRAQDFYLAGSTRSRDAVPPIIVQFTPGKLESTETMEEDLSIMTRIFEKALDGALGEDETVVKMGVRILLTGSGRSVRAAWIEGTGALFMIKVNFPVLPPAKVEAKKGEPKSNTEWERTARELKGISEEERNIFIAPNAAAAYNEEKVDALKQTLLAALKQATNIRQIAAGDTISICVFGAARGAVVSLGRSPAATPGFPGAGGLVGTLDGSADGEVARLPGSGGLDIFRTGASTGAGSPVRTAPTGISAASTASGQGSVLTLKVKKAEIDAYATGTLKFETFMRNAVFHAYPGSGQSTKSFNSWVHSRSSSSSQ